MAKRVSNFKEEVEENSSLDNILKHLEDELLLHKGLTVFKSYKFDKNMNFLLFAYYTSNFKSTCAILA